MNKIFKVIWSKSKQCYIVVSEIAKNKTGKKKIVVASILAVLTMTANVVTVEGAIPEGSRTDQLGLAIGTSSNSKSNQSVAIGYASSAQAPGANPENPATAVGAGANANGAGAVALGLSANATGANAVALGGGSNGGTNKTEATGVETTAVGFNAKASNSRAAAIGSGAASSGSDAIAFGTSSIANSEKAIAIGTDSKATAIGTTALGRSSAATGASATALGSLASASGTTATAVGMQASATGNESVAIGQTASATSGRALAVGTNAKATGENSVAVGSGAGGSGPRGFASSINSSGSVVNTNKTINYATTADGDNAVALGFYANAKNSGVAVGQNALAATGGVAIGKGVLEDTSNHLAGGVAIGQDSASTGAYSLAMGRHAFASGSTSMAIGYEASANGNFAVAMGRNVTATGTSTAIGRHAVASNGGLAIGSQENDASNDRTTASAKGAVAIGKNANATSEDAVAIGTNAQATLQGAVALGSGSTTATGATSQGSTTINGITYNFAGATGNPNMQVSVGSAGATRQIKNVAAGEVSATSTDAINGSQLYAVARAVKPLKYVSVNSAAAGTGSNVDNDGAQGGNSIAIGPSSTVTRQNGIAIGSGAQSLSEDSVVIGRDAKAETKTGAGLTTTSRAIVIGSNSRVAADVTQGVAIGSGLSPDEGAVVTGDQSIAIGGNVKVDGHSAIAIGGDDARKAANQLVSYTNTDDTEVTGTLQTAIQNLTGYNLSNYKGTTASHAGVAYGTSALAGNAGVAIGTAADSMTRMNDKGQVVNNKPVTNAVAIGTGARANFDNSVAIGGGSNTDHYATKQVNAVIDGVEVKWSGGENISPGDVVSFGAKGFERQLKNVAPGEVSQTSTDAINGSQIYSLARKITNIMNGGAGSVVNVNASGEPLTKVVTGTGASKVEKYYRTVDVKDDGTLVTGAIAQTPTSLSLVNVDQTNVNQQTQVPRTLSNVADGVKDNDAVNVSQLNAAKVKYFSVNSTVTGNRDNTGATGVNAIAIGPAATATKAQSIALGNSATAGGTDSIAIGNGSVAADKVAPVAIGRGTQANGDFSVALGGGNHQFVGAIANGVGTTALGTYTKTTAGENFQTAVGFGANTTKSNATAIGYNSAVSTEGGVALGANSSSSTGRIVGYNPNDGRTNTYSALTGNVIRSTTGAVAVGNGTEVTRQITGVAAGTNDTDAVNVAQLKSVNLAFVGDSGFGDVNLANNDTTKRFAVKGDSTYLTTRANGNLITVSANKKDISVTNGTATAAAGMADAKNVAEAINKAVSQNAYTWNLTADNDTAGSRSTINKEGTVKFSGDQNITVARNGNTITSSLNKSIIVDSVKANNSVTTGSGSNQITLDGTTGAVTGNTFSGQSFTAGDNVLSNTTLQIGSPTNGNNVTITKDGLTSKAGTKTAKFGANGIDAGGQQITNVSSGGNVGTNAANITDVKNAVSDVTLKLDTNSKTGTVKLSESPLKVIGANGIRTDLIGTNNGSLVVGLDSNTVNATTKGIGLTGDTGSTGLKYLKDGDASFKVAGDGNLVTTKASATGVQVAVDTAKVKDLAVEAVTVSKANTSDNPITVTPTAGTNSKDYAIGIDTTKLASKTDLTYRANNDADANAQKVSLAKGLNFVNGDNTVATVAADGKVSYDLNAATKTKIDESATAVARNISLGADSGTASSQSLKDGDVAFNVKGATGDYVSTNMNGNTVEVSTKRATINSDANTGAASVTGNDGLATAKNVASAINSAVNGLSQNLNISDGTTDSTVALKNQKLTVTGTGAATATVNNQTITVNVAEGTLSNNADGTVKADAAGVATTKNVADVINKSISDNQYSWKLSANGEANTATVGKGDTVDFAGDTNITVDRNNKTISTSLNKNLTDMNSISLGNARGETIFLNGRDGSIKAGKAEFKDNVGAGSTITSDQLSFTNGATGANEVTTTIALDTVSIQSGPNNSALTSKYLMFSDEDGNNAEGSAKGMAFKDAAGKMVQFSLDEIKAGGNKIQEVAEGTADTDAVNVKQLKDTVASQTLTYRANTASDADAKSVKLSKGLDFVDGTSTVATVDNDGKVSFDLNTATKTKIDDSATAVARNISLGADSGIASSQSLKDGDVAFNVKGATGDYVSTNMNGNTVEVSTKRATINSDANTGAASVTGNDGLATAKNVADAINKAADAAKAGAAWNLTTNSSTTDKTSVQGGDTVDFINGDNILISQDGTDKKKITVATKKDLTVDSVTAGNTVINTSGLTNGTTAITGSGITTDKVTVGGISIDKTDGINAGGKAISNVASGGTTDTNAANIGDVKQAVANLSQNLNITDGTNNGTVNLKNQKLNLAGANGVTATVNNQTITVGLDANTVNATTKGIGLTADTGSTGNKYLKDGDVSFAVTGDGNLVSTSATAAGVKVAVDAAKVKDLAVDAVTVSKDAQADNPITVTPTAGTNSKDYAIGIDTTKLAAKTDLTYRANNDTDANAKKVSLAKGLNFVNGTLTTASTNNDGVVKYDVNTAAITAGTDGTVTGPTTDGVATAQNVADAINAAKKAAKTEITANTGGAANATTGNVTLTSTTAADGHTIYDVKLNDKVTLGTGTNTVTIDGTAGKATVGTAVVDGVNNTITTGGANAVSLDGAAGTVTGLTNKDWTPGVTKAVTGRAATEDQLQKVADAASSQTWNITADKAGTTGAQTGTKKNASVGKDQTVELVAGDNLTINQDERKFTYSLNKDLAGLTSVSVGTGTTETIKLDGATGKITAKNAVIGGVTVDGDNSHVTGLSNTTWNGTATTGRAATEDQLKAVADTAKATTDAVNLKFSGDTNTSAGVVNLKDDTFNIVGDGKYVTTDANGKDLTVKVSEAEVKKSAVSAVTVSTDTTDANNPISVTPTTSADGTTKDYKVTIDGTKIANKTNLSYKANDGTAKQVSLADGLNFKNGTLTTASIDDAGVVKYDVNTATITAGTDGTVTGPTTDGVATAQNIADAINAAKKAAKTEITANTGEAANATTGNVTLTSTTAADGHTIYDVKLNDKVTLGTGANAVTIDGTAGKISAKNAAIGGVTVDGDNSHVTGLSNTTWNGAATTGRAATEDQLKAVADTAKATTDAVNLKFSGDTN
ncbi:ESPR-type extended signal peptide-containing protein, partial [Veillonella sp.]|uniref:ESPR-type extended signal peptide-containing protein n=1 Tax=Veillonella sp. TaxID=1926307 RepID=UPI0028FF9040